MIEKLQINPLITPETRDLLRRACQERSCAQGEIVEAALRAYLCQSDDSQKLDMLIHAQHELHTTQMEMQAVLERLVGVLEERLVPAQVPIATYEAMYGPIDAPAPDGHDPDGLPHPVGPPQRRRLRRWFVKEKPV